MIFAPDGRVLVTGDRTGESVILWDVADPARPHPLGQPLAGVDSATFAPDGRTLATSSTDQSVILWDVADPARPRRLGQPLAGVDSATFAPDGRTLATSSTDQS